MNLLSGKYALVTGGTRGIGRAIALKFAQMGASVLIYGTNKERGKSILNELRDLSDKNHAFYQVDVSDKISVDQAAKEVLEHVPSLDIIVNNAGITKDNLLLKMSEEEFDRVIDVNLKSCFNVTKSFLRMMIKQRSGKIINMASIVGLRGNAGQANYAASKMAMIGWTKSLAVELGSRNICVNAIAPGYIKTDMTEQLTDEQKNKILSGIPMKRMGSCQEVANTALFLASYLSDYMTGQTLVIDGGKIT